MEIKSTRRIDGPSAVKRAGQTVSGGGQAFVAEDISDAKLATPLTGTGALSAVDTILALQGVGDSTTSRSRGLRHGEKLLSLLDEVRDGLLAGSIGRGTLQNLALAISKTREDFAEPQLAGVLDEIDLRARVELAKLEQADRLRA